MISIALVTPLPPQHTGIADYASDLIFGLYQKKIDIDLYSNISVDSFNHLKVYNITKIDTDVLKNYDLIIYQMGNNIHFHSYMTQLMQQYPGIIHLHDMVLHHSFVAETYGKGKQADYLRSIKNWYGNKVTELVQLMIKKNKMPWESEIVTDIPLFEEYLQYTNTCIVHSEFVKNKIQNAFPKMNIYKVPQLYNMDKIKNKEKKLSKKIKFGIFGGVDPQKKVDIVLEAFGEIFKENRDLEFSIKIVGDIHEKCNFIKELPEKFNLQNNVKITGRVDENKFMEYLNDIDVLIALRSPTMGETSAIVMRAMQLEIPTIVNDIGWYSELPEHIIKIPVHDIKTHLISELTTLFNDENKLNVLKKQAMDYSINNLNFEQYIELYLSILQKEYSHKLNQYQYTKLAELIEEMNINDTLLTQKMLNKIIDVF